MQSKHRTEKHDHRRILVTVKIRILHLQTPGLHLLRFKWNVNNLLKHETEKNSKNQLTIE